MQAFSTVFSPQASPGVLLHELLLPVSGGIEAGVLQSSREQKDTHPHCGHRALQLTSENHVAAPPTLLHLAGSSMCAWSSLFSVLTQFLC